MLRPAKILLVGTSVATVAFAANAQDAAKAPERRVDNLQVSLGDVFAGQTLNVIDPAAGVSLTAAASAAAVEVETQDEDVRLRSAQRTGSVRARTELEVHGWSPTIDATAAAVGTSVGAEVRGGAFAASTDQAVEVDGAVEARTEVTAALSSSGDTTAAAIAVGNDGSTTVEGGHAHIRSGQFHYGQGTAARVDANLLHAQGSAAMTAYSAANQQGVYGQADHVRLKTDQVSTGATGATVVANVDSGASLSALSAAAANSVSVGAAGGKAEVTAVQSHEGYVRGEAYLTSGEFGDATVTAMAVANTVSADLSGPELTLDTDQVNSGGVEAEAAFLGGTGSQVTLSATALGNAVHGSVCTECDGSLTARNSQTNNGDVSASGRAELSGGASVRGTAHAVGNSAAYIVNRTR